MPQKVAYAVSKNLNGPWVFKGIINEIAENCETKSAAILGFKDRCCFIYHNGAFKDGGSHRCSVCTDYLYYNNDNTIKPVIMTSGSVAQLK